MIEKRWLVVSSNAINAAMHPVVVRVTKKERERSIPTAVEVQPDGDNNLPDVSYVLCHDFLTLTEDALGDQFGRLGPVEMIQVEVAMRLALSL